MRRCWAVMIMILAACTRAASSPPTTTTRPAPVTTATVPATVPPTSTTAPPTKTGDDDKPQVQALKDYFKAYQEAIEAKNPDLIDPYVDPETPNYMAAAKRQIIQDYTTHRVQPSLILTTTLGVADSIGPDGRHQAAVAADYTASDRDGRPVVAHQAFALVWSESKGRWLVFGTGQATESPR